MDMTGMDKEMTYRLNYGERKQFSVFDYLTDEQKEGGIIAGEDIIKIIKEINKVKVLHYL